MELYRARGGGRETSGSTDWPLLGPALSATWPLCQLVMTAEEVHYKMLMGDRAFKYDEIKHVRISRLGYVVFAVQGDKGAYGFTGKKLNKVIEILQSKGVKISKNELVNSGLR